MADGDPEFLVHLAMRSLAVAAEANAASHETRTGRARGPRFAPLHRIGEAATRITLREVAELDLATEIYRPSMKPIERRPQRAARRWQPSSMRRWLSLASSWVGWRTAPNADPSRLKSSAWSAACRNLLVERAWWIRLSTGRRGRGRCRGF